jgi:hypothetical protein
MYEIEQTAGKGTLFTPLIVICTSPVRRDSLSLCTTHSRQAAHHTTKFVFNFFTTLTFFRLTYLGKPLI